jgi:hypothetical protein
LLGWRRFDLLKSANSDRNQQSDNPKYNNKHDGREERPGISEEAIRWKRQLGIMFIILQRRPHIVGARVVHFSASNPSSSSRHVSYPIDDPDHT